MQTDSPQGSHDTDHIGWCMIPPTILTRKDLTLREQFLMGRILGLITTKGYCYASNVWLGKQLGISKHTVSHLITSLVNKGLVTVELLKDHANQITERRIYPLIQPQDPPRAFQEGVSPKSARGVSPISTRPLVEPGERGIAENGEKRDRDIRVEKRVKKKAGETSSPVATEISPSAAQGDSKNTLEEEQGTADQPEAAQSFPSSVTPCTALDTLAVPPAPLSRPPYLPNNFPFDHPICQVLSRFADHWAAMSRQILDVSQARAVREVSARLPTTPLPDLLALVDLWFDPGLSWVTPSERGSFHTFIQPRPISELKGLKAGLSSIRPSRQTSGYIKPMTHEEWANIPTGRVTLRPTTKRD